VVYNPKTVLPKSCLKGGHTARGTLASPMGEKSDTQVGKIGHTRRNIKTAAERQGDNGYRVATFFFIPESTWFDGFST